MEDLQRNNEKTYAYSGIIVTIRGNQEALVENYQGIIAYDSHQLRLKAKKEQLQICGSHLAIAYYTREELKLSGSITKIEILAGDG